MPGPLQAVPVRCDVKIQPWTCWRDKRVCWSEELPLRVLVVELEALSEASSQMRVTLVFATLVEITLARALRAGNTWLAF